MPCLNKLKVQLELKQVTNSCFCFVLFRQDDIETLNPQFRLTDKEIKLPDAEMNIFINNALQVALHLQTEFLKLDVSLGISITSVYI